ncbi:ABC transporter ATP-binding protein [Natronosporangium hydrolyticum]|uniref:ABC transporter ATP-binding protein n=1 Tax=Natronosporangium hydrolyticum TaxID=2811111 RepID=A0A895YJV4_9ACTN|nr:ABC transporter ATP-binding protein [Natronosporangium hydrolyticum]QSB14390.1 ABC transporter ATP-binding protein [Natronosporangium hydrolyticum]
MPVIEVTELRKRYGDTVAVADVSFSVDEGEIFGILGRNGAGKTTTVECLAGLRRPDGGKLEILGIDPQRDPAALRPELGVQLQRSQLPEKLKVWEALDLYASYYDQPADWRELLDLLGLADKQHTRFAHLSGGQQQRLSIALALVGNPRIAILDELTTGLDPVARRDTWAVIEQIRDRGVTVVLVTHFMAEAERLCDRLAIIDAGRVVALDSPAGLVAQVDAAQRLHFRLPADADPQVLAEIEQLSAVTEVTRTGRQVIVAGTGDLLFAVSQALSSAQVTPSELRVEQRSLDDAFVALTGRPLDAEESS